MHGLTGADEHQTGDRTETMQRRVDAQRWAPCEAHFILIHHHVSIQCGLSVISFSLCTWRLKLTWARSAGTTRCSPAPFFGSRPQRAIPPWSSSVAMSSPEMHSTNSPMLGSEWKWRAEPLRLILRFLALRRQSLMCLILWARPKTEKWIEILLSSIRTLQNNSLLQLQLQLFLFTSFTC